MPLSAYVKTVTWTSKAIYNICGVKSNELLIFLYLLRLVIIQIFVVLNLHSDYKTCMHMKVYWANGKKTMGKFIIEGGSSAVTQRGKYKKYLWYKMSLLRLSNTSFCWTERVWSAEFPKMCNKMYTWVFFILCFYLCKRWPSVGVAFVWAVAFFLNI